MSDQTDDTIKLIRQCYLFTEAQEDSLKRLAQLSHIETLPKGRDIFSAGDPPDGLRILISGLVRTWINNAEGRELTLTLIEPGDAFGEIALLDGAERSANTTVLEPARLLLLRQSAFDKVLEDDPALMRHLIVLLCDRLRRNTEDLRGFAFHDMGARLAAKLFELTMVHAVVSGNTAVFGRKFSQTELANMLGATREAINKRLSALSYDEVLSIKNGLITILDLQALRALGQMD
ncbi:Crp/Fnr family transcriptional regulator [Antarctobacter heliothermus]|uniref:cAMP-binding domain of CRP or a regulatory subunit of cAMP-dependent protein kinases n=1 Tax=Antarctobacter heliothermus TaxID=74033 RepID=A0A239FWA9_9RHOB|nr:Crp/Fnr family transcriptional regulator [Antarctobacter heliothermus]SNS61179.1 cAMP-binding domain of CRP or a regulatory subunit of cAMP-dependent protein kinases [Antarctobacter heliothermus]